MRFVFVQKKVATYKTEGDWIEWQIIPHKKASFFTKDLRAWFLKWVFR